MGGTHEDLRPADDSLSLTAWRSERTFLCEYDDGRDALERLDARGYQDEREEKRPCTDTHEDFLGGFHSSSWAILIAVESWGSRGANGERFGGFEVARRMEFETMGMIWEALDLL